MGVFRGEDLVNTNAIKVSVFPVEYSYESDTLSMDVHYDVRLLSISEDYYRYMKIMRGYSITIGDANFGALIEPADIRMWRTALGLSPDIKRINCVSRCRETRCLLIGILGMDKPIPR